MKTESLQPDLTDFGRGPAREEALPGPAVSRDPIFSDTELSDAQFRDLVKHSTEAMLVLDEQGCICFANASARELFGYRLTQPGREPLGFPMLQNGGTRLAIQQPGRQARVAEIEIQPTLWRSESAYVVVLHDITERLHLQAALQDSLQMSEDIVRAMPAGLFIYQHTPDDRLELLSVNPEAERITGITLRESKGRDFDALWPGADSQGLYQTFLGVVHTGEPWEIEDLCYDTPELRGYFRVRAFSMPGDRLGVTFEDVTARRLAEQARQCALEQQKVLLRELHHRVKNNLQIVSSLLNLQLTTLAATLAQEGSETASVEAMMPAMSALRGSRDRVHAMALAHENLYRAQDLSRVPFAHYVESLVLHLFRSHAGKDAIRPRVDVADITMDVGLAVPCGLLINELVSNALRHAFPEGKAGEISVSLWQEGAAFVLRVADTGVGLPPDVDVAHPETLGLQLVHMLVKQIAGTMVVHRETGTAAVITFGIEEADWNALAS